jgi:hypothetical protein
MMDASRWLAVGGFSMLLAAWPSLAGDPKGSTIPDADYAKVVAHQVKVLTESLKAAATAEPLEKKRLADKAKSTAIILAQAAQDNLSGANAAERATLRDAALAIVKLLPAKDPQFADALKLAEGLEGLKANPAAKKEKIQLLPGHTKLEVIMIPYQPAAKGGQGLEAQLLKLSFDKKKNIPPAQLADPLLMNAYQSALIAEMTRDHKVDKDQKKWQELSDDMRRTSLELAAGVRDKDGKAAFAALAKLNESCAVCHKIYRDATD